MERITILALSGSLRKGSYNTALIRALTKLAPEGMDIVVFEGMGNMPLFNPDLSVQNLPAVRDLQERLSKSDGLIIASPEYAHGISGVLKNALDWLVADPKFVALPVALFNASPRASHAQQALREVINTMSGNIIEDACASVALLGSDLDMQGIINHREISVTLKMALTEFGAAVAARASTNETPIYGNG